MAISAGVLDIPVIRRILTRTVRVPRQYDPLVSGAIPGTRHLAPLHQPHLPVVEPRHVVDDLDNLENATWEDAEWQ